MFIFNFLYAGLIFSIMKDWVYFLGNLHSKPCSLVRHKCKRKCKEGKTRRRIQGQSNFFQDGGLEVSFGRSKSTFRRFCTKKCKYLFSATENVSLYCKQFEIHLCIILAYLLFISPVVKHTVFWSQLFCQIFSGKFSSIHLHNVYHKALDISLHSLLISRWGGSRI